MFGSFKRKIYYLVEIIAEVYHQSFLFQFKTSVFKKVTELIKLHILIKRLFLLRKLDGQVEQINLRFLGYGI